MSADHLPDHSSSTIECPFCHAPEGEPCWAIVPGHIREHRSRTETERNHLRARLEHAEQWYGERWARLRDEFETLGEDVAIRLSNIVANGTAEVTEPPTYAQQMNRLRAENGRLRKEMTIYFMALEQIRDRTHQKRLDDSAPTAAHNFARRALEQGFGLRSGALDELQEPTDV